RLPPEPNKPRQPAWVLPFLVLAAVLAAAAVVGAALVLLNLTRTLSVTVVADGAAQTIQTPPTTVADALKIAGVALNDGDHVSPALDAPLTDNLVIRIERARSVFLMVDGETTPIWTPLTHPAEILASAGVQIDEADSIEIDG